MPDPSDSRNGASPDSRLDYTFLLMAQLARVLDAMRGSADRYNGCLELSILLHPFHDPEYSGFLKSYMTRPEGNRVSDSGAWLQSLMDLLYRNDFLGRGDRGE
jgi:hypothetical protein